MARNLVQSGKQKQLMAQMPEITTMSGGNPIADNHNSIQPI
jgi:hypothetical protein